MQYQSMYSSDPGDMWRTLGDERRTLDTRGGGSDPRKTPDFVNVT